MLCSVGRVGFFLSAEYARAGYSLSRFVDVLIPICTPPYASPNWLATYGHPKTKDDLSGHRCLVYSQGGQRRQWHLGGETVSPDWSFACNNGSVLRRVALDHGGLVYLPEFFVKRDLEQGTLARIDDAYPVEAQPILVVFPHRRHLPLKVRVFIDFLIERL